MALINLTVKHGRSLEEARLMLQQTVEQARAQFGPLIQRVVWSDDHNAVKLHGVGFEVELRVDPVEVHVTGDSGLLGQLLGNPFTAGLQKLVQHNFTKLLT